MTNEASSIDLSLETLAGLADDRISSERRQRRQRRNAAEIKALVARKQRKRVEQARAKRDACERLERRREQARLDGMREGAKQAAHLQAQQRAKLEAMRAEQALALDLERLRSAPRPQNKAWWLALPALLAVAVFVAATPDAAAAQSDLSLVARSAAAETVARMTTEAQPDAPRVATTSPDTSSDPESAAENERSSPPPRATPQRPRSSPVPATTAHTCDDSIGDPCCAFGVIAC